MTPRLLAVLLALAVPAAGTAHAQGTASCRESFQYVLDGARGQWPDVSPYLLSPDHVDYFMRAYNAEVGPDGQVPADRVLVVPLPPDISSTWWYFGFDADCLTFYAELSEAKGVHMIERGHTMAYPQQRLE